jgi:hypothetical protein
MKPQLGHLLLACTAISALAACVANPPAKPDLSQYAHTVRNGRELFCTAETRVQVTECFTRAQAEGLLRMASNGSYSGGNGPAPAPSYSGDSGPPTGR